eukprot:40845-Chlamydomonas_euryale.AAC.12
MGLPCNTGQPVQSTTHPSVACPGELVPRVWSQTLVGLTGLALAFGRRNRHALSEAGGNVDASA